MDKHKVTKSLIWEIQVYYYRLEWQVMVLKLMSWKLRMVSSRVNNHMTNNTQPGEKFQEFSPTLIAWCMNDWVIHKPGNNDGE